MILRLFKKVTLTRLLVVLVSGFSLHLSPNKTSSYFYIPPLMYWFTFIKHWVSSQFLNALEQYMIFNLHLFDS